MSYFKGPNKAIHFHDGTTVIALERRDGSVLPCLIDTADWELVRHHRWHAHRKSVTVSFYAFNVCKERLHSLLLPDVKMVDHHDRNGLNNRRINLRPATNSQNMANSRKPRNGLSSQFKGVVFRKICGKFQARVRGIHLGNFVSEYDAAAAYNAAATNYYGEFALLNDLRAVELKKAA